METDPGPQTLDISSLLEPSAILEPVDISIDPDRPYTVSPLDTLIDPDGPMTDDGDDIDIDPPDPNELDPTCRTNLG